MEPLIKITSVPIAIEYKTNNARFEYKQDVADVEVQRTKGGLQIRSKPIKLSIDTFEARNSISPSPARSISNFAQEGIQAAYEATASFAEDGMLLLRAKLGQDAIGEIAARRYNGPADFGMNFGLQFLPSTGPEISWSDPDFTIQYEMDKLNFDWKINKGDFEFIPGNIEISIKQHPSVTIEYIGPPIYVPPSASPNYVPIDTKA